MMKRICATRSLLFLIVIVLFTPIFAASGSIPNALLRVTVQQKEGGKLNKGFHLLELFCMDGNCSLSSVSVNQCAESGFGKQAFYPRVQYSATSMGNLIVRNEGSSLVVQETGTDMFGDYINNLRFDYESVEKDKIINRLIGFSGGYIKNSSILKKVYTIEYVPLPQADQIVKLDCEVLLPGIDKK